MTAAGGHVPVMPGEVIAILAPADGAVFVDGTFGGGGYSRALLEAAPCTVWGIDRDADAIARGRALAQRFGERLKLICGRFGDMAALLAARGVGAVDGVALDLGLSSPQIDTAGRGFSFRRDGPLDMRMGGQGPSAADVVNGSDEAVLADIIHRCGQERRARRVARAIVAARREAPIERTLQLAAIVRRVVPQSRDGIDPATRTFQALRIHVNDELGELRRGLGGAEQLLAPGGRLAVLSFHSLEDRIVKRFLDLRSGRAPRPSRHAPDPPGGTPAPSFSLPFRKALRPGDDEVRANPRARSARLRAALRVEAPAWPAEATP